MAHESEDLFRLFPAYPSAETFSQQYLQLSCNMGNFLYLPFVDFLVDTQILVFA